MSLAIYSVVCISHFLNVINVYRYCNSWDGIRRPSPPPWLSPFPSTVSPTPVFPLPSSNRSFASRAFRAGCSKTRPLSAVLCTYFGSKLIWCTLSARTFYAQWQWTCQGFLLVFSLLILYILLFILYSFVYCYYIYVLLDFGLFYLTCPLAPKPIQI
jgi:hypothetical protein